MLYIKNFFCILMILIGVTMPNEKQINNYFQYAKQIIIYNNGNETSILQNTENFSIILTQLNNTCHKSHEMPAFSVSIDSDTKIAMQDGIWIELIYDKILKHNEMPFDRLLIQVNSDYSGFNIIRHYQNRYNGRCFYLNLDKDMSELYNTLINI